MLVFSSQNAFSLVELCGTVLLLALLFFSSMLFWLRTPIICAAMNPGASIVTRLSFAQLVDASTLKKEVAEGVDLMVVRELTGGLSSKAKACYTVFAFVLVSSISFNLEQESILENQEGSVPTTMVRRLLSILKFMQFMR